MTRPTDADLDAQLLAAIPNIIAANLDAVDEHGMLSEQRMVDLMFMARVRLIKRRADEAERVEAVAA